jgi:putative transposase
MPDHVHMLVRYPPRVAVAELMRVVKTNSSRWVHQDVGRRFGWQNGYSAFAVSESVAAEVVAYIRGQEEHHRTMSFKEEYVKFLQKNNVTFDERWVWD